MKIIAAGTLMAVALCVRPAVLSGQTNDAGGSQERLEYLQEEVRILHQQVIDLTALVRSVFAKTGVFSPAEIQAAASTQDRWVPRVILLSKDELEPYDILDRHPETDRMRRVEGIVKLASAARDGPSMADCTEESVGVRHLIPNPEGANSECALVDRP